MTINYKILFETDLKMLEVSADLNDVKRKFIQKCRMYEAPTTEQEWRHYLKQKREMYENAWGTFNPEDK